MALWKITARQLPTEYQASGRNYWYSRSIWDWRWAVQPDCVFAASRAIPSVYGLCNGTLALLPWCKVWQNQVAQRPRPLLQHKCIPQQFISVWQPTISFHLCNILPSVAPTEDSALTSALLHQMTHTPGYPLQASPVVPVVFWVLFLLKDRWWELTATFQTKVQQFLVRWQEHFPIFTGNILPNKPYDLIWLLCLVLKGV